MRKGFTLIELLAVIVILAIIALIATPLIINVIDEAKKGAFKDSAYGIVEAGEIGYTQDILAGTNEEVTFSYTDGVESSSVSGKTLNFKGTNPKNGKVGINDRGKVAVAIHDGTYCAKKDFSESEITITKTTEEECIYFDYNVSKGVNAPKLTSGMTPIKWNGTSWEDTTEDDSEWYSYTTTDKKWANAKTADGSFWVWIPRYAYQIASGYNTNTAGTINIKFLIDYSNTTSDGTTIDLEPTYSGDSQTNYITHPSFKFGSDEVTGIWVAKFESSNDGSDNIQILPNVASWRNININDSHNLSRSMENNSIYGWETNGNNLDTHMMKNNEWGAIAYLSKSSYGKGSEEIWINPVTYNSTTGCAGDSVSSAPVGTCTYTYESSNGVKASTTGNIYGIYDMSGGGAEYVMGNYENTSKNSGILDVTAIPNKYLDWYGDNCIGYPAWNRCSYGGALYETSSSNWLASGWHDDGSYIIDSVVPWMIRGGVSDGTTGSGIFAFSRSGGDAFDYITFRPVIIIGEGL